MDFPGTAFSRSIGDSLAKELGVIADPEMVTRELERGDEMIILASDGVFEFLTNQSVIDICASFKDPLEGKICSSIDFTLLVSNKFSKGIFLHSLSSGSR